MADARRLLLLLRIAAVFPSPLLQLLRTSVDALREIGVDQLGYPINVGPHFGQLLDLLGEGAVLVGGHYFGEDFCWGGFLFLHRRFLFYKS